jgi:soluble epoxide hydrolase/lipid-phosphate phosphatase
MGFPFLKTTVNRSIYPSSDYEWGQWVYMRYYKLYPEQSIRSFQDNIERVLKSMYKKHDRSTYGKPAPTITVLQGEGQHPERLPGIFLWPNTVLDEDLYAHLVKSLRKNGFFAPTAYYLNHAANASYAKSAEDTGVLEFPVLFIDAKYDAVCSPGTSPKLGEDQREKARRLTYKTVEAGHWVQLEKPKEVNEVLENWLGGL